MLIRETDTDFDKHLKMLEDSEGQVFFFSANDNPARFKKKVVETFMEREPPQILFLFHLGVGEKKARSIARSAAREITEALGRRYNIFANMFILPPKLFNLVREEHDRKFEGQNGNPL